MDYVEARSLSEACAALADGGDGTKVVAGGVALSIMMRWGFAAPQRLVSVRYLEELRYIRFGDDKVLRIGAATTHREVERSPLVREYAPALAEMEQRVASVQIRNSGTLGGNLCHADSAADPGPVLLALGAQVTIASVRGKRTLPLHDFFGGYLTTALAPDEVLVEVALAPAAPRSAAVYLKHSTRNAVDFPFAGVAAQLALEPDGKRCAAVRLAVGAVAPTPTLSAGIPGLLQGELLTDDAILAAARNAAEEVDATDDAMGSAEYRRHLVAVLAERSLIQARALAGAGRA